METAMVIIILSVAVVWAGRSAYRTLTGKQMGCRCTGCGMSCDTSDDVCPVVEEELSSGEQTETEKT